MGLKIINRTYSIIYNIIRCVREIYSYYQQRNRYSYLLRSNERKILPLDITNRNILIIVPHADDDLIGCFTIINRFKQVYAYYIGDYSNLNKESILRRDSEFNQFANSQNLKIVNKRSENHSYNIKNAINALNINIIVTPDFNDWHVDHQCASKYVIDCLNSLYFKPMLLTYSVTVPKPFFKKSYFLPMDKQMQEKKWNMFNRFYISQRFMPVFRFKLQERINAIGIKDTYACELFTTYSYDEFIKSFNERPMNQERSYIRENIINIKKIRQYSDTRSLE